MQDEPSRASAPPSSPADVSTAVPLDATRPFRPTEYEWAFGGFIKTAVDQLMVAKSSLLSKLEPVPASEIHISRNTTDAGEVVENNPVITLLPITIDFKDVLAGRLAAVAETINSAAEEGVGTIEPQLLNYMRRVTEAFGTRVDLSDAPFDHVALRRLVEAADFDFDENGQAQLDTWVFLTHDPTRLVAFDEMIRQLPPRTREEVWAWDDMIERKRLEFSAKRRRRTLS